MVACSVGIGMVGERVRLLRHNKGLSLDEFAVSIGVSKSTLWSIEQGRSLSPTVNVFIRIATRHNVSLDWLLLGFQGVDSLSLIASRLSAGDRARLTRIAEVLHG